MHFVIEIPIFVCKYMDNNDKIGRQGVCVLLLLNSLKCRLGFDQIAKMLGSNTEGKKWITYWKFWLPLWFWVLLNRFVVENPKFDNINSLRMESKTYFDLMNQDNKNIISIFSPFSKNDKLLVDQKTKKNWLQFI